MDSFPSIFYKGNSVWCLLWGFLTTRTVREEKRKVLNSKFEATCCGSPRTQSPSSLLPQKSISLRSSRCCLPSMFCQERVTYFSECCLYVQCSWNKTLILEDERVSLGPSSTNEKEVRKGSVWGPWKGCIKREVKDEHGTWTKTNFDLRPR